jgi:hypothetical protein
VDLLNQSPDICCYGEIFKKNFVELPEQARDKVGYNLDRRNEDPFGYLKCVFSLHPGQVSGFKIFPGHSKEVFPWCLTTPDIKRIALWRNPVDVYVSLERAKATGEWINRGGESSKSARPKLTFNPTTFEGALRHVTNHNQRLFRLAETKADSTLLVSYDDVTNMESVMGIFDFLGVPRPDHLDYRLKRQTVEKYSELYTNFDEFGTYLAEKHPEIRIDAAKM